MRRCWRVGRARAATSSMETAKRPERMARALAARMRYWEARGPGPQETASRTKAGAVGGGGGARGPAPQGRAWGTRGGALGEVGRVERARATAYLTAWSATGTRRTR